VNCSFKHTMNTMLFSLKPKVKTDANYRTAHLQAKRRWIKWRFFQHLWPARL